MSNCPAGSPGITQLILEDILGGGGIKPHCYPEQTSCPDLGCMFTLNLTGVRVERRFFFHADGDAFGRRLFTACDCPFWRTVLSQLLAVVGGRSATSTSRILNSRSSRLGPGLTLTRTKTTTGSGAVRDG